MNTITFMTVTTRITIITLNTINTIDTIITIITIMIVAIKLLFHCYITTILRGSCNSLALHTDGRGSRRPKALGAFEVSLPQSPLSKY